MKSLKKKLVRKASEYVRTLFKKNKDKNLIYHNIRHTKRVVRAAKRISKKYDLSKHEYIILLISAWFHDTGHLEGANEHEAKSALMAEKFLSDQKVDYDIILSIKNAIMATRIPQKPTKLIEEILCDADLYHFGTRDFYTRSKELRKETQRVTGLKVGKKEWISVTIDLLRSHRYFTDYSRKILGKRMTTNINKMIREQRKIASFENA